MKNILLNIQEKGKETKMRFLVKEISIIPLKSGDFSKGHSINCFAVTSCVLLCDCCFAGFTNYIKDFDCKPVKVK